LITTNQKYRPSTLADVYGQEEAVSYFQAVGRRPQIAARNYTLLGPSGCGKTTLVRAFASGVACAGEDPLQSPNYMEFDSSSLRTEAQMDGMLPYIFSEVDGWKVVLFDEAHLLPVEVQKKLLKPLEDFVGQIFFFFATTEAEGMISPLVNRCLQFTLRSFSETELRAYLIEVLGKETVVCSDKFVRLATFLSGGLVRNLLNQIDLLKVMGEEEYLASQSRLPSAVQNYFLGKGSGPIEDLCRFPFVIVRDGLDRFFRNEIIRDKKYFRTGEIGRIYVNYLRFKSLVKTDQDFYSVLHLWKESFEGSLKDGSHG